MNVYTFHSGLPDPRDIRLQRVFGQQIRERLCSGIKAMSACAAGVLTQEQVFLGVRYLAAPGVRTRMYLQFECKDTAIETLLDRTLQMNRMDRHFCPAGEDSGAKLSEEAYKTAMSVLGEGPLAACCLLRRSEPSLLPETGGLSGRTLYMPAPFSDALPAAEDTSYLETLFGGVRHPLLLDFIISVRAGQNTLENAGYLPTALLSYLQALQHHYRDADASKGDPILHQRAVDQVRRLQDAAAVFLETAHVQCFVQVISPDAGEAMALGTSLIPAIDDASTLQLQAGTFTGQPWNLRHLGSTISNVSCYRDIVQQTRAEKAHLVPGHASMLYNALMNLYYPLRFAQELLLPPDMASGYLPAFGASTDDSLPQGVSSVLDADDMDRGAAQPIMLDAQSLKSHLFISGRSGSGKTTTVKNLLVNLYHKSRIPFLLIEPVKGEFRDLLEADAGSDAACSLSRDLVFFTPGREDGLPVRINPLEPLRCDLPLNDHIKTVSDVFNAAFPLTAPCPMLLEKALVRVYAERGWPFSRILTEEEAVRCEVPTMRELRVTIEKVVSETTYDNEYKGILAQVFNTRFQFLETGTVGRLFDCRRSVPALDSYFDGPVVLELDALGRDQKGLISFLLLSALRKRADRRYATRRTRQVPLEHLVVIEEAHNLVDATVSADESGYDPAASVTEFLCTMLAEARALGQGIVLAEQSAAKMPADVLRNTATKIAHACSDSADREALAEAMMLDSRQMDMLTNLPAGDCFFLAPGYARAAFAHVHPPISGTPVDGYDGEDWDPDMFIRNLRSRPVYRRIAAAVIEQIMRALDEHIAGYEKEVNKFLPAVKKRFVERRPNHYGPKLQNAAEALEAALRVHDFVDGQIRVEGLRGENVEAPCVCIDPHIDPLWVRLCAQHQESDGANLAITLLDRISRLQDCISEYHRFLQIGFLDDSAHNPFWKNNDKQQTKEK